MPYGFKKIGLFDGRWTSIPGLEDPVRTGPRGRRFWDFVEAGLYEDMCAPEWPAGLPEEDVSNTEPSTSEAAAGPPTSATSPKTTEGEEPMFVREESRSPSPAPVSLAVTSTASVQATPVEREVCTCVTSYTCPHRAPDKVDCRPLTAEWKKWRRCMDEAAHHKQIVTAVSPMPAVEATRAKLSKISTLLDTVESLTSADSIRRRQNICEKIRDWIIEMHSSDINGLDLQATQVIPRIDKFLQTTKTGIQTANSADVWIEEELTVIMRKWSRGDLRCDPKRGLKVGKNLTKQDQVSHCYYQLDKTWPYYRNGAYFGAGHLVNGQVWFSRVELMRDGVHSASTGGISGSISEGAYSVVMSHADKTMKQAYANIDMGEVIEYMGTALKCETSDKKAPNTNGFEEYGSGDEDQDTSLSTTRCTASLMRSIETGKPVRVVRSFLIKKHSKDGPTCGYRYDGLYVVTKKTLLNKERQEWRFRMERMPGQGLLRSFSIEGNIQMVEAQRGRKR